MENRIKIAGCAAGLALLLSTTCSGPQPTAIIVGAKNVTEQKVLSEIIAQHVERKLGREVRRVLDLSGTLAAHQALLTGTIDLYPEYSGTALTAILKAPVAQDPKFVLDQVRAQYRLLKLEIFDPLGFDNSYTIVVRAADARANHWTKVSDAASYGPGFSIGVGFEFMEHSDGYSALMSKYQPRIVTGTKTMEPEFLYKALEQREITMAAGNVTDAPLATSEFKVLEDDKNLFPPYQACIVARSDVLIRYPKLKEALAQLSGRINEKTMRQMNFQVDVEKKPFAQVAGEFLSKAGLR